MPVEEKNENTGTPEKQNGEVSEKEMNQEETQAAADVKEKAAAEEAASTREGEASATKKKKTGRARQDKRQDEKAADENQEETVERVVKINRVSKVVKGGKNFSFNALVVAGDGKGRVGIGFGKSNEVVGAIVKGTSEAKKNYRKINLMGDTIPHEIIGRFKATHVVLKPASPGTGVIAGGPVRAMCDAVGIKNILTKSLGSRNTSNVIKATMDGLSKLRLKRRG